MNIINFIKTELSGWTKAEKIMIPLILVTVLLLSLVMKDTKIATISALFGIMATIISGKGKISCYFFGIVSVLCYSYLAYKNALWGALLLYVFYYFPMEFVGIYAWKNHLKEKSKEIEKTFLSAKERLIIGTVSVISAIALGIILKFFNDQFPFLDAFVTILSIIAMYLTIKRCIEQWICWTVVNLLNVIIWLFILKSGGTTLAMLLMWLIYLFLGISFFFKWKKEIWD